MKTCARCGIEKPEDEFYKVKYKNKETKYRYSVCKQCTAIEQKRRYLLRTDPESPLLEKIEQLYAKHVAEGRKVPESVRRPSIALESEIDKLLGM